MVRVNVPTVVFDAVPTVNVEFAAGPIDGGLNELVAPDGRPLAKRLTELAKPFSPATLIVYVALTPCATEALAGEAEIEKSGLADTFRVTVAVCVSDPAVPVTVMVELPTAMPDVVVIVSVELAPGAIEGALKDAVAPVGRPLALKVIEPVKPFNAPALTVYVVLPPGFTTELEGVAESEKSGGAVTFKVTGAV
jgi:hypothetical protein